jgi:hypothetical protein
MYCTECGTKSIGGKFCGTCGTPVAAGPADTQASSWSGSGPVLGAAPQFRSNSGSSATGAFGAEPGSIGAEPGSIGASAAPADDTQVIRPAWPVPGPARRLPTTRYPWDYGRDIGAAVLLIWSLTLPWRGSTSGSGVVHVLLTTLVALFSLAVAPLSRVLRAPDGSALRWPTLRIRAALCAPYAVVVLIAVIRELAGAGPDLGESLQIGVLGVAIAVVPRESELAGLNGPLITHRFRLACAVGGGLGIAAMVISTLVAVPPSQWFGTGSIFFLAVVPILILVGLFDFIFGATAIRIGMGHPAWQPTLVWIGVAAAVLVIVDASSSTESSRNPYYGLWLFMISAGLAATPMIGGRDGARTEPRFWALVVGNAFRLILVGTSTVLVVFVLILVQAGQYGGSPSGELIWILISAVGTIAAAAVGSSQLRADPRRGRTVALICVGLMALFRVVDLAVAGWSSALGSGSASTIALLAGTYGVIVFALIVPTPMRQLVGLQPIRSGTAGPGVAAPLAGAPIPAVHPGPAMTQATPPISPQFTAPAPAADPAANEWNTDLATTVMITNHRSAARTEPGSSPAKAPNGESTAAPDRQARAAADPSTSGQDLMSIAGGRPDLRPAVAANPSTYPALLDWLRALGDPTVDAALARRRP